MIAAKPLPVVLRQRIPYPKTKRPLGRSKAVTIGVGFLCADGILLCADTQITWPEAHKYYERKIFIRMRPQWTVGFTYAGNPNVAKSVDGKLEAAIDLIPRPFTVAKIQNCLEALLSTMDVLDTDPAGLHMLCGVVAPEEHHMIMLKTERKIVSRVRDFDYVGVGDSSLLRYMSVLIGAKPEYRKLAEAFPLAVYLVFQAKRYIDGCGGETDAVVIKPDGVIQDKGRDKTFDAEHHFLWLENSASAVIRSTFNPLVDDNAIESKVDELCDKLKQIRGQLRG